MPRFKTILISIFILLPFASRSQNKFERMLDIVNATFEMPKGFSASISLERSQFINNVLVSLSECRLLSRKEDVVIYTVIIPYDTAGTSFIRRRLDPTYDRNDNYKKIIASEIDTTKGKIVYLNGDTLAKLNATVAGIYNMKVDYPYKGIYKNAKLLF